MTVLGNLHGSPVKAPQAVNQRGHNRGLADVSRVSADYDGVHLLRRAAPPPVPQYRSPTTLRQRCASTAALRGRKST